MWTRSSFYYEELYNSEYAYCSMSCNFHIQLHTLRCFAQSPGATAVLERDLSQRLLHLLNKHEANPPSATLVRGQSSYLQEQQIQLQSKPVLGVSLLTHLQVRFPHVCITWQKSGYLLIPPPLISIFPLRPQLPFFSHYYFFLRITGPFISLIFECACQNVYQIFSIREYFHFLFSVMLCSKTHFPPHLLSRSNKTEQKETVQSSWTLDI